MGLRHKIRDDHVSEKIPHLRPFIPWHPMRMAILMTTSANPDIVILNYLSFYTDRSTGVNIMPIRITAFPILKYREAENFSLLSHFLMDCLFIHESYEKPNFSSNLNTIDWF